MTEEELCIKLKENYEYNPETGLFTRIKAINGLKVGHVVTTKNATGYVKIGLLNKTYMAHRLAFLYMTGFWPEGDVDHKDTDRSNNKWVNLRSVTKTVNSRNRLLHKNNTSGAVGVSWSPERSKWQAYITVGEKMISLGRFECKEDAILARMDAEKKYGFSVDKVWDKL